MKKISTAKNEVVTYTKQDVNINSPEQAKKELENRLALTNKMDYMAGWLLAEMVHAVAVEIKTKNENYSAYKTLKDFVEDFGKISNGAASQLNGAYETRDKIIMLLSTTDLDIYWENVTNNCSYSYLYALKPLIDKSEHFEQYNSDDLAIKYTCQTDMLNDFVDSYALTSGESVKELQKYIKEFLTVPSDDEDDGDEDDDDEDDSNDEDENTLEIILRTADDVNAFYNIMLEKVNAGIPIKVNYHKFVD